MMRGASFDSRRVARLVLGAILVVGPVVALACSSFSTPEASPPCKDCDEAGIPIGDGGPLPLAEAAPPEACKPNSYTLAGCLCEEVGAFAPCYQGVPGDGGCAVQGAQQCAGTPDGTKRWSTCVGGSLPKPEVCHNLIDDNCDGVVDDGCPCSDSVDLCQDGVLFDPNAYTAFTVPAKPTANKPFDIYLLTKDRPLVGPDLQKDPGGLCGGRSKARACPSVGKNCEGWKVAFFMGVQEEAGAYTYNFLDPGTTPPCGSNTKIANLKVVVP